MVHVREVKTGSGATAVQIVWSNHHGRRDIEHVGSAHTVAELELLHAGARQRILANQPELDLGLPVRAQSSVPITGSRMGPLWDVLEHGYDYLGFDKATGHDEVFKHVVLARIIEPTSKQDCLRVLDEAGVAHCSYRTLKRRLATYSAHSWRESLSQACAEHATLKPSTLVLYDVSTLYFETDAGDGFRESGFSKERRLEPQIIIGLLTDAEGFPLTVDAFEGNKAETKTMLPVIQSFMATHSLDGVTVVADSGMMSDQNLRALEAAGLDYIIGGRLPDIPYQVLEWMRTHPGLEFPDGLTLSMPTWAGPGETKTRRMTYWRYSHERARRSLHGIDQQITKAKKAIRGEVPVKRNRYVTLTDVHKSLNTELEAKNRTLAGWKTYRTSLDTGPDFVIGCYHQLWQVEKSFRMSKHDLRARPIYAHTRDSIEAHLTIVFAALALSRWIEATTGWTIKKIVKSLRRYRIIEINTGTQTITAEQPLPDDLRTIVTQIHQAIGH